MSEYIATLERNPYKLARLYLKMTQGDVARALGITTQMVYRHENGLVGEPSEDLSALYALKLGYYPQDEGDRSIPRFTQEYKYWVSEMRASVRQDIIDPSELMFGPYADVNHLRSEHPFYTFMYNFNSTIFRFKPDAESVQLFNRLLCIAPRCVELYLASRYPDIENTLRFAMLEVGITEEVIHRIEREVGLYQVRNHD